MTQLAALMSAACPCWIPVLELAAGELGPGLGAAAHPGAAAGHAVGAPRHLLRPPKGTHAYPLWSSLQTIDPAFYQPLLVRLCMCIFTVMFGGGRHLPRF